MMTIKPVKFVGSSRRALQSFPDDARRRAGQELFIVQLGREPNDWKPLPEVAAGVCEIRVHIGGAWRVIYVARLREAVYVLHAFHKKTQRTSHHDIEIARLRYRKLGVNA